MQVNQIETDNGIIENAVQKIINDFYNLPVFELEILETNPVYQGEVLSLDDMEQAIDYEAGFNDRY
jgi:hypothetical protein